MSNNISIIISREYFMRVRKKAFYVTTLIMPILMIGLMFAPALMQNMGGELPEKITVVDATGKLGAPLAVNSRLNYVTLPVTAEEAIADTDNQVILVFGENAVSDPTAITLYTRGSSSLQLETIISGDAKAAIEAVRLESYDIPDLENIINEINADVVLNSQKLSDKGETEASDSLTGFLVGMAMSIILYFFIMIYGQLVMQSVIEEKSNRVLELIVTSVKPTHLMLGKIIGVGAVAVTQVLIWAAIIVAFVQFILPLIAGPELSAEVAALKNGTLDISAATTDPAILQSMAMLSSLGFIFQVFGYLLVYLIGGFMLYASLYAAIGAAVDNPQDGAQLQTIIIVPIIIGFMFAMSTGSNPNSELATILSIVPFTSPMVMLSRIPSGVPAWEIITSIVTLFATIAVTIWFTAKIYRVGIFMYGKKPSWKELIKWARYK